MYTYLVALDKLGGPGNSTTHYGIDDQRKGSGGKVFSRPDWKDIVQDL